MSIKDRFTRIVRGSSSADHKPRQKPVDQTTVSLIIAHTFSFRRKPSSWGSRSGTGSSRFGFGFGSRSSSGTNNGTHTTRSDSTGSDIDGNAPANLDGLRWEDMTDAQRVQASFNAFEIRFGASSARRASLEGISPCTTRVQQQADSH